MAGGARTLGPSHRDRPAAYAASPHCAARPPTGRRTYRPSRRGGSGGSYDGGPLMMSESEPSEPNVTWMG